MIRNLCNTQSKMQNFNGLWGKTSRSTDYDAALGIPSVKDTFYYYPFVNESSEEIKKVVDDSQSAYIEYRNRSSRYRINECKICYTLPFNEDKYNAYKSYTGEGELTKTMTEIHKYTQDKFLTRDFGNNQVTAGNDAVSAKLLSLQA